MVTLIYRAKTVGPVCNRVAKAAPTSIRFARDHGLVVPEGLIVRWGSVIAADNPALNSADAVQVAKDKIETRRRLGPLAPPTFFKRETIPDPEKMPCVIRPAFHHAGKKFYVCSSKAAVNKAIDRCGALWYASLLIDKAHEYRVFVCQGHVVAVSERFPADAKAVAWNLAMGGRLINVRYKEWPIPVCKAAIAATEKLGLDWCAIDLAVDTGGDLFVFEANTAPGLRNPFTIGQIARTFTWIDQHGTPKPAKGSTWQTLMHPALR